MTIEEVVTPPYYIDNRDCGTTEILQHGISRMEFRIDIDPIALFLNMVENCQDYASHEYDPKGRTQYEEYKQKICADFDLDPSKY